MSIDIGQGLTYDKNFPVVGQNQPSQQFRDNFAIIKTAIENIQSATSNSNSVINVTGTLNTNTGAFQLLSSYKNNALVLPIGAPTGTEQNGMIRFNSSTNSIEFYSGGWNKVISSDSSGNVSLTSLTVNSGLTLNYTPSQPNSAVNVSYVNSAINSAISTSTQNLNTVIANVTQLQSGLQTEINARTNGDANLQQQIDTLVASSSSNAGYDYLNNSILLEANTRLNADNTLQNQINNIQTSIGNINSNANTLANDLNTEVNNRISGDNNLQNQINSVVLSFDSLNSNLLAEANTRQAVDNYINSTVTATTGALNYTRNEVNTISLSLTNLQGQTNTIFSEYSRVFVNADEPTVSNVGYIPQSSLWFDSDNSNALNFYDNANAIWVPLSISGSSGNYVSKTGDTMTGQLAVNSATGATFINPGGIDIYSNDPLRGPFIDFKNDSNEDWDWRIQTIGNNLAFISNTSNKGAFIDLADLGDVSNSRILISKDGFFDMANTTVRFPNSNVVVDANHFLLFQSIPNTIGSRDGGGIRFDSNNLHYAYLNQSNYAIVQNAIAAEMAANSSLSMSQAIDRVSANAVVYGHEFGVLRIFTTNDYNNGVNNDSMALEPSASLYLNPGWSGGGDESNPLADNYRVPNKSNAFVVVGNAFSNVVTINASNGDIISKGNITGQDININGDFNLNGGSFNLPNSDMRIDANHSLIFEQLPANQAGGVGDSGFITYDTNNFDYAPWSQLNSIVFAQGLTVAQAIANSTLNSNHEFSCLRIGVTNDPIIDYTGNTFISVADMVAIEPAADLYLNPGWSGLDHTYGQRVPSRANAAVYVGNSSSYVLKIEADTGNLIAKGTLTQASDISLKDNVETISNSVEKINQIGGYTYTRNDLPNNPKQMGVIAQEVELIAPELVSQLPSGMKAVNYPQMAALFVEAIKELSDKIEQLQAEIDKLKGNK